MNRQSFTLVEMLTVLAIIMVLAGLVFPAVNSSRTTARATACLSNQKQVITAINMSMTANKNRFYSPAYTGTDNGADDTTVRWTARLKNRKYLPEYSVMRCTEVPFPPTKPGNFKEDAFTFGAVHHDTGNTQGFDFRGTKYLRDSNSSSYNDIAPTKLMIGGCSWNTDHQGGALLDLEHATTNTKPYGTMLMAHRGAINLFFLDGRSAAVKSDELGQSGFYYPSYSSTAPNDHAVALPTDKHTIVK